MPTVSVPPAAGFGGADESAVPPPVQATRRIAARNTRLPRRVITRDRTPRSIGRPRTRACAPVMIGLTSVGKAGQEEEDIHEPEDRPVPVVREGCRGGRGLLCVRLRRRGDRGEDLL